jgi:DNA-binding MarR family transcriptional regulator
MDTKTVFDLAAKLILDRQRNFDEIYRSFGLTSNEGEFLFALSNKGSGQTLKVMAAAVGIDGPAASRVAQSLVSQELITRVEDEHDRRSVRLALTDNGEGKVATINGMLVGYYERFPGHTPEKMKSLYENLNELVGVISN